MADLLFNIEDEFGISLPPEPVELLTVGDVVRFIDGLIAKQPVQTDAPVTAPPVVSAEAVSSSAP